MPHFSVVIPTYNRLSRLQHVIDALEQQQFSKDDYEVIVVSDGATDGTNNYLDGFQCTIKVRSAVQANQGPAAARNRGLALATGDYILFIDDDVVPGPQLMVEHMRAHRQAGREVAVLGPLLSPPGYKMSPWVGWEQDMLMKQYSAMLRGEWEPTPRQFYTGNASLRREHILAAGGFDDTLRRAEDVELAYRLASRGLGFVFAIKAEGWHFAERSFRSWLDAAYTYGRNDVVFGRDRQQTWLLGQVRREFDRRNVLVRQLVRSCLGREKASASAYLALKATAQAASWTGPRSLGRLACSGLFNLRYYQGFCDELGDPKFLFRPI
jgi:glycosyltransferase involved in cell wall biosynthesis